MNIGSTARLAGVSVRMLRYYTDTGLVSVRRTPAGYRTYEDADVPRIRQIKNLLDLGFTTDEIRPLLPCVDGGSPTPTCQATKDALRAKLACVTERREALEQLQQQIETVLNA